MHGDALNRKSDAIVNLANNQLNHGGGIAAQISKMALKHGDRYNRACASVIKADGILKTGHAFICNSACGGHAGIITTVGPVYTGEITDAMRQNLANAYYNTIHLAAMMGLGRITLSPISIGIFAVPPNESFAALVKVLAVHDIPIYIDFITNDGKTYG